MAEEVDVEKQHQIDERLGFHRYQEGPEKLGWLVNIQPTTVSSVDKKSTRSAVDLYFLEEDGEYFKCTLAYDPYFYVICKPGTESDVDEYLRRKFERVIQNVVKVQKTDLHQPNHLVEPPRTLLKLMFRNTQEQMQVRRELEPIIRKNKARAQVMDTYTTMLSSRPGGSGARILDPMDCISDMREYDVPYYVRVTIDNSESPHTPESF
ncbi:DNA polymerase epsilon catalytic subunit [Tieghemiomyces parasiticus]|uniref:DNA polymerase epsilon catalytic subunit n=1 Tax=Tieghemiomyces parasiticus TaxID=78921 RepID=A0A9W8A5N6_9FUNG|nr:DNA polymerase epsilon catalytic subunit [Tieghemiomyces parasiticus]